MQTSIKKSLFIEMPLLLAVTQFAPLDMKGRDGVRPGTELDLSCKIIEEKNKSDELLVDTYFQPADVTLGDIIVLSLRGTGR